MTGTTPPSLTLFFVADNSSVQNNRDLFTWAPSADDAIADWKAYYETRSRPQGVFAIPTSAPARGVVPWNIICTEALS